MLQSVMPQANRNILKMTTVFWCFPFILLLQSNALPLTSFTHHRGNKLGDDGAPLSHLALLAVGEVGEDARDASGTGRPARVHQDQHLHYGGVHIPDAAEWWREKPQREGRGGQRGQNVMLVRCFKGETVLKCSIGCLFFLTWTLFGSQRHLSLAPTLGSVPAFLWKQTGRENEREARKRAHINTQSVPCCAHS